MSYIENIDATSTSSSITLFVDFYISDQLDYRVDMTLYDMEDNVIKSGWTSWSGWGGAPGVRSWSLTPDYPLPSATQYRYAVQLSRRDSGTILDRETDYVSTRLNHFEWDSLKIRGEDVNITASEWNRLLDVCAAEVRYVRKWKYHSNLCNYWRYNYCKRL